MIRTLTIAFAFVGIIVGAAFASGRESLQFYTSFGIMGTYGVLLATLFYAYCGMMLVKIGQQLKTKSHRRAIYTIAGPIFGKIIDYVIIFTMFGVGVGMVAGAGSILNQQYGLPYWVGNLAMTLLVAGTIMLRVRRVVQAIGFLTPILLVILVILCLVNIFDLNQTFAELEPLVLRTKETLPDSLPNWWIAAFNHASFNIAVGSGMAIVMGGDEEFERHAIAGGILGGIFVGAILMLAHLAMFARIEDIAIVDPITNKVTIVDMPLLVIAEKFSPIVSSILTVIIFGMIYNTAVSMFYVFVARFVKMETPRSKVFITITCTIGFILSFLGFTKIVGYFYPFIGYVGIFLMGMLFYAPYKLRQLREAGTPRGTLPTQDEIDAARAAARAEKLAAKERNRAL